MKSLEPKIYVNAEGIYQGSFSGIIINGVETYPFNIESDWVEVPTAPENATQTWNGESWTELT